MQALAEGIYLAVRQQVDRGIGWLNENAPGWERVIESRTLDMSNGRSCIAGQVGAVGLFNEMLGDSVGYEDGPSGYDALENRFGEEWCVEHGFNIMREPFYWTPSSESFGILGDVWVQAIIERFPIAWVGQHAATHTLG